MGLHPDVQREKDAAFVWWRNIGTGMKIQNSIAGKIRENPDFGVAVGAMTYSTGKHEIDFNIARNIDAYCYVGFAVQDIDLDKSRPHSLPLLLAFAPVFMPRAVPPVMCVCVCLCACVYL